MKSEELHLLIAEGEGLTVEFKERYTPKIDRDIVALANSKGGFILLGVSDDGKVTGEKLTNQMKADILSLARNCEPHISNVEILRVGEAVVIEIAEGDEKPYSCSAGYFRRLDAVTQKMVQKEVRTMFKESTEGSFESMPCKGFSAADISFEKIKAFLRESQASFQINKGNLVSFLSSLGIHKDGRICNAGVLAFARDIGSFVPHAETVLGAFKGTTKTYIYDRKNVKDDLLTQLNESMAFLKKHLNVRSEIRELDRRDIYEIPLDALREALVNAIVHRDYSMRGTNISVNIFDDRVEVVNPGGLPAGLSKSNFGKESVRRNLIIADIFHRMDKMEKIGSGIVRMRELMKKSGLKEPVFESDSFFRAVFYRDPRYALKQAGGVEKKAGLGVKLGVKLGVNEEKIVGLVNRNKFITIVEIAEQAGVSSTAVENNIAKLKAKGVLSREGSDKTGYWKLRI